MSKLKQFILSSFHELKYKVVWPSYDELQKTTVLVLIGSVVFSVLVGFVDISLKKIMLWVYKSF